MSGWEWLAIGAGLGLLTYTAGVGALVLAGRRSDAQALARFIPDCVVLFRRLIRDPAVPRRRKILIALLVAYLVMPIDLVPDFIPVAGLLDDALVVAFVLRAMLRSGGPGLLREHWPGPTGSLEVVSRLAFGARDYSGRPTASSASDRSR